MPAPSWLDRAIGVMAPRLALKRQRARMASELLASYYDLASGGRRTQGWRRAAGDANAAILAGGALARTHAHDLVRNNPWAASAVRTIVNQLVGWAITAEPEAARAAMRWRQWTETTACDADGRHDFGGLQALVGRTTVTAGECLIRRRWRRASDGLPIPMQLQVLEPDHLDSTRQGLTPGGGRVIQGVQFDGLGRRTGYWLYPEHPGSTSPSPSRFAPVFVPASEVLHVFKVERPGQVRGISWLAPVTMRLKDFDEYEDAALLKQKIAACLSIVTTDVDGTSPTLGVPNAEQPDWDMLEPGVIKNIAAGRSVQVVQPPSVSEHDPYSKTVLRGVAAGLGITFEDLTGSYEGMPYSASRMSRLRGWATVEDRRWHMLIPQFCEPVFLWAMEAASYVDDIVVPAMDLERWTAPPLPMLEPDREGLAYQRLTRSTLLTFSEALRERGYNPAKFFDEYAKDLKRLRDLGIISDADAGSTTQSGQLQGKAAAGGPTGAAAALERSIEEIVRNLMAAASAKPETETAA